MTLAVKLPKLNNSPPKWVNADFSKLKGSLIYARGEHVLLNYKAKDADKEDTLQTKVEYNRSIPEIYNLIFELQ